MDTKFFGMPAKLGRITGLGRAIILMNSTGCVVIPIDEQSIQLGSCLDRHISIDLGNHIFTKHGPRNSNFSYPTIVGQRETARETIERQNIVLRTAGHILMGIEHSTGSIVCIRHLRSHSKHGAVTSLKGLLILQRLIDQRRAKVKEKLDVVAAVPCPFGIITGAGVINVEAHIQIVRIPHKIEIDVGILRHRDEARLPDALHVLVRKNGFV